ncbi:MAG: SIMPL domain-containing protein, partial [Gallicola sp.]|nr:SIMPL domain-containing protein [Gallicola sp.]
KAELEVVPDKITLNVQLSETDNRTRTPLEEREKQLMTKLAESGVNVVKNVKVKDQMSSFQSRVFSKDIVQKKEYLVTVADAATVQRVFANLEAIGISNVSVYKLENSKIEQHRKDVKAKAIKAAQEKARSLAEAVGQTVGKAIYVQEINFYPSVAMQSNVLQRANVIGYGVTDKAEDLNYEFQNLKVESTILCRFELK